ncbi:hypothetical protein BPOR_0122g00110 [Botrytis porri]|uniref:BTB domain-containing protein n=1 Tax=Botrytis porri TaxID=87229 RepID=A0A4Z1KXR8_9HELO|nr:hypothetical protein BPOR_0122g00110 [Botrytis porri]
MAIDTDSSVVCKAPFEVPACEFYERSALFHGGDMVKVILGPSKDETNNKERVKVCEEKFELFQSKSDESSVNANDQHHNDAVLDLNEWDVETFDMALQWMYTGNVVVNITKPKPFEVIRLYIQFFKIAKALDFQGSYSNIEKNLTAELAAASEEEYDEDD